MLGRKTVWGHFDVILWVKSDKIVGEELMNDLVNTMRRKSEGGKTR
jgi:hypothetical protein